jgi:hypothetical protein
MKAKGEGMHEEETCLNEVSVLKKNLIVVAAAAQMAGGTL